MKSPALFLVALAMSVAAFSQTSTPAAPTLTAGAEFKGLRFDWEKVPGATWYQFEYRAHQTGAFVQQGDDFPATATSTRFTFPLHLFDWTYARYRLAACNSTGCARSAAVSVSDLRRDAVGYFKSSQPVAGARFGASKDLSPDGYNMVASESVITSQDPYYGLINGGFVSVFRRNSDGSWTQRARLDAGDVEYGTPASVLNLKVAISATGNTVALGMPNFVPGRGSTDAGEVYVYYFKNGVWGKTHLDKVWVESYGTSVALSDSGYILAVGLRDTENSVAIFKSINSVWTHIHDLSLISLGYHELCDAPVMSRDGRVIAERCDDAGGDGRSRRDYIRVFSGTNWTTRTEITLDYPSSNESAYQHRGLAIDGTGSTIAVQFSRAQNGVDNEVGFVKVYKRDNATYSEVTTLNPGAWRSTSYRSVYGDAISVSGDGQTIAVGDTVDNGTGWGPRAAPLVAGTAQTGAVYVYRLSGGAWKLANMVKPNYNPNPSVAHFFGESTALSGTGKTLIVAAPRESSSASGIGGNWANTNRASSGAIFMY